MITIRTGSYTQTEKENMQEMFSYLADIVCCYCDAKTGVQFSLNCVVLVSINTSFTTCDMLTAQKRMTNL